MEPPAVLRPLVRPESVEIAALPEPEPVPLTEPVVTPRPAVADPVDGAAFPDQSGNRPAADADTANVALPTTPDNVEAVGAGPDVEIAAVTPGNEIVPEPQDVVSTWNVQLPFSPAGAQSNIIAEVGHVSPVWVQPGLVITSVNGTPVSAIADISEVLRQTSDTADTSGTVPVTFGTLNPASGEQIDREWVVPVIQEVALLNGVAFETAFTTDGWRTVVTEMPDSSIGGLQVGDVMKSYISATEEFNGQNSLPDILDRELSDGKSEFMFAVEREGTMWVALLNYEGATD